MESKNMAHRRSCSAVQSRTAGKNWKDTGSLPFLSSTRQSITDTAYLQGVLSKISNQKSSSSFSSIPSSNIYNNQQKIILSNGKNICFFPDFTSREDTSSSSSSSNFDIQGLKCKLQNLILELIKEKNIGQVLKKNVLVAKKVVETEIAANAQDFESLVEKANNSSWNGRQKTVLALRRELRNLNEVLDSLNDGTKNLWIKRKTKHKTKEPANIITDDRKINLCLDLERREVSKNAERYRQNFVVSRDLMLKSLERLTEKNEMLLKEIQILQKMLYTAPKQIDEDVIKRLHDIRVQLKTKLEEKSDERRKINILEEEICRNCKIKEDLKTSMATERQALKEKGARIKSLTEETTQLRAMSEYAKKEKLKQSEIMKKKIEVVERHYDRVAVRSKNLLKQLTESKYFLVKRKGLQLKENSISFIRQSSTSRSMKIIGEQLSYQHKDIDYSKLSLEIPNHLACIYKNKLLKYQSIFHVLDRRNEDKVRNFHVLINETKEGFFELLENRYLLRKIASDIKTLQSQNKKLKKVLYTTKQKFVKKKNSSEQMMEVLNERKTYLAFMKKENKCLEPLIRDVLASKEKDCDLLKSYLTRNKDMFLKKLTHIKV